MDRATICTQALNLIGEMGYGAGTPGKYGCDVFLTQIYTELLQRHDWSFARRLKELMEEAEGVWELPVDCLRVVELRGLKHWRIYGRKIRTERESKAEGKVELVYTSSTPADGGELPEMARMFAEAVVQRLASALAAAVKHDMGLSGQLMQLAESTLNRAMTLDTQQDNSNDQHPLAGLIERDILKY